MPITAVYPGTIRSRGSRTVTINGTNLLNLLSVSVQGDDADTLTIVSDTEAIANWEDNPFTPGTNVAVWYNITGEGVNSLSNALTIIDTGVSVSGVTEIADAMTAIAPSLDIGVSSWKLGDTLANGDDIASTSIDIGPGFAGRLDLSLVRADSSVGDSSVKIFRRYKDKDGSVLSAFSSPAYTVNSTPAVRTMLLPSAPAGTVSCELGLLSNMNPPGNPVRTNLFQDPRATTLANFYTRYSWGLAAYTSGVTPITGLTTYVRVNCTSSDTGAGRGINLYDSTDRSTPLGAPGYPVTGMVGQTITISAYIYATKAGTFQLSARGYAGTTWKGSAGTGSSVSVAANTWTRLSVTYTVATGATDVCVTAMTTNSVAWVNGDYIGMTAILFEAGNTLSPYFDGTTVQLVTPPASSVWQGAPNNSNSLLWSATTPGGTSVTISDSALAYSADARELIGSALERDMRRSVADIFNDSQSLITAGTPGLLSGSLTYLCDSLAQALAVDAVYRMAGLVTLESDDELSGLTHRAVGRARINPERALPGKASKWLLQVEFREQVS